MQLEELIKQYFLMEQMQKTTDFLNGVTFINSDGFYFRNKLLNW
jgi:hypothetical protein